ncbi:SDR family NAD(P)-dependent oxidoreductase [Pirellulales bacterium]|nr:SDR family NAD(P)-dependent oxidoreductase [Pirellulales bacterium]
MNLNDKIALVTGGSKGIGAATAITLAQRGAHLAINGRHDDDEAAETRRRIEQLDRRCEVVLGDMSVPDDAKRCVEETVQKLGGVDVHWTISTMPR